MSINTHESFKYRKMTEQQQHLQQVLEQQKQIEDEVRNINDLLQSKKELYIKLQGIVEYLQQLGVTLPTTESEETVEEAEETAE